MYFPSSSTNLGEGMHHKRHKARNARAGCKMYKPCKVNGYATHQRAMLNDLLCFFFGHKYKLAQELSPQSRRVCCTRCRRSFAMNDDVRLVVDWGPEFHRMYESHGVTIKYQPWEYRKT